ncbi:MAG: tyrosine-type recombinase/integrase, partial [Pyrinomonadaceae bacterium]
MSKTSLLIKSGRSDVAFLLPPIITGEGPKTTTRFLEFFAVNIRNPNTRLSYARAIGAFLFWCNEHRVS